MAVMDAERLGQQLRAAREAQELSLDEVAQVTRIRAKFLAAFESGAYDDLPGVVQARGFLRNYARFLRLDEDGTVAQFDRALAASDTRPRWRPRGEPTRPISPAVPLVVEPPLTYDEAPTPGSKPRRGLRRTVIVMGLLLGTAMLAALCIGGAPLVERILMEQAGQGRPDFLAALPTSPSITPSSTFIPSGTPRPGQQVAALGPPITDRVVFAASVVQRTFVRVIADNETVFEGLVEPGETLNYEAAQIMVVQASNGAGLDVIFNNLPQGVLGGRGEAVDRTYTPDLALTPTAELLPTETPTRAALPGQENGGPTPLPIPGAADASATPLLPPGAAPQESAATPTLLSVASPTPQPTATVMPTVTPTPSPTPVLPPRLTGTPTPSTEKTEAIVPVL